MSSYIHNLYTIRHTVYLRVYIFVCEDNKRLFIIIIIKFQNQMLLKFAVGVRQVNDYADLQFSNSIHFIYFYHYLKVK